MDRSESEVVNIHDVDLAYNNRMITALGIIRSL